METIHLKKITDFYFLLEQEEFGKSNRNSSLAFFSVYLEDFKNEFDNNLFGKDENVKRDVLRHYIFELYTVILKIKNFFDNSGSDDIYLQSFKNLNEIFAEMLNVLNLGCVKNGFDFLDIVTKLKLDQEVFDLEYYDEITKFLQIKKVKIQRNPYPLVFKDYNSFQLFKRYEERLKKSKTPLAYCSFLYWSMSNDGFIIDICKPEIFKKWLKTNLEIDLNHSLKTLDRCKTESKLAFYASEKKLFFD
jgi:hypothetical protein